MWILLYNPTSGGGKGQREARRVTAFFRERGADLLTVSGSSFDEASRIFQKNLKENVGRISGVVVVGGDGMMHMAVQELAGTSTPIALVPAGTGNDFARALGLDLKHPTKHLPLLFTQSPEAVDLGLVNGRYFADILSTGFDSIVNEKANSLKFIKGRMKYNIAIALVLSTFRPQEYRFSIDSVDFTSKAMLIAVSNGQSYGGGMKVTPHAKIDDGLFDVMILGPVSKIEFLRVFPRVFSGSHVDHPAVKIMQGKRVRIQAEAVAYADGERIGDLPIEASVVPQALLTWRVR